MALSKPVPHSPGIIALEANYARMAALVESQMSDAISAFERRDVASAKSVVEIDVRIDDLHRQVEDQVMTLLRKGPLLEEELREAMSVMKVAGELERVGDLAKNVAKRTLVISQQPPIAATAGVLRMGRASLRQVSDILNAYGAKNIEAAKAVWGGDDDLDELFNSVFQETVVAMMADSSLVNACTHLAFIAKNFERAGDHATNIAEALHFLVTGSQLSLDRPKGDVTSTTAVKQPTH